jgi:enoyl-CoA hydratase/carnithine racemase
VSPDPAGELLIDEPAPGVARLVISNPARRGALDQAILDRFAETMPALQARCVIITGQADVFSAGYDIGERAGERADPGSTGPAQQLVANPVAAAIDAIDAYPYPTVAALNGHAIGGGLELAVSCDLRIAARPIELGMPPARLGLVYSYTGIRKFIDAIGAPRTRELFFIADRIEADTAHDWGLVNMVVAAETLEHEALSLARQIAASAPLSQRGNKRVINEVLAARARLSVEVERELVALWLDSVSSEDFREGVRAFVDKRPPRWRGR